MDPVRFMKGYNMLFGFVLQDLEEEFSKYPVLFFPTLCIRAQRMMLV